MPRPHMKPKYGKDGLPHYGKGGKRKGCPLFALALLAVLAVPAALIPASASAAANLCTYASVSVSHNKTETNIVINDNDHHMEIWAYGIFNDPQGPTYHPGYGTSGDTGYSTALDTASNGNVYGGWALDYGGKRQRCQTY